ncbi:ATP-binding protein [Salinimicrobium soli]|uniref:ATP-binding protein n=1 Tax=Salinimicrobium soli TaxID=1254399 RepID=UPI003AAE3C64
MKIKRSLTFTGLIFLLFLWACEDRKESQFPLQTEVQPGTPLYFYNKGLDTSDLEAKLKLYNTGLDSIRSIKDTMLSSLLEGKVYALMAMGQLETASPWIDSLITVAKIQKDSFFLAKGYYRKFTVHNYSNQPGEAYRNAYLSKQVYLQTGDTSWAGRRSLDMANIQIGVGDYSGAQESATEALEYLDRDQDSKYVSSAYNVIGLAYMEQGFNEEAIREYKNALQYATRKEDSLSYLHNMALSLRNEKKYKEALEIFGEIVESDEPDVSSATRFLDNMAFTMWLQDPSVKVDSLLFTALNKRQEINDHYGIETSYMHLTEYYFDKDKAKAKRYGQALLKAAKDNSNPSVELLALKKMIELAPAGERKSYVDRFVKLDDSLDQAQRQAKYQFAKINFDEEQKQKQIRQLEAVTMRQALKTQQLESRTLIISLFAALGAAMAGIFFYYFKQRAKRERLREVYLTENRISKRIHDELANDIYNVMNHLENVAPPAAVDQLEHIYNRTRDISRENAEIDTGESFQVFLLGMLSTNTGEAKLILRGEKEVNWDKISPEKKIVLYRVLQELMVNMKKHSGAPLVAVSFEQQLKMLRVQYSDTGKGTTAQQLNSGNGLKNLVNRLRTVDGIIDFTTKPGRGLKAEIRLPLK